MICFFTRILLQKCQLRSFQVIQAWILPNIGPKVGLTAAFDTRISNFPSSSMTKEWFFSKNMTHKKSSL